MFYETCFNFVWGFFRFYFLVDGGFLFCREGSGFG